MSERRLRLTVGSHEVDVWPDRFTAGLAARVRAVLGRGPKEAFTGFVEAACIELDAVAEMVVVAHAQAGVTVTLADAGVHPVVAGWDRLGSASLDLVGDPTDEEVVS